MKKPITLKKYNNRRLYDFSKCAYCTLERVRELVRKSIPFHVIDTKDNDITARTLLECLLSNERYHKRKLIAAYVRLIRS